MAQVLFYTQNLWGTIITLGGRENNRFSALS